MEKNQIISLALLFSLSIALRACVMFYVDSFTLDESIYAQNIDEFVKDPTLVPRYLGEPVAWKPPLLLYTYSPFVKIFLSIGIPLEAAYRLPSFFISLGAIVVFYFVAREFLEEQDALVASAVYSTFAINIFIGALLMTDNLFMLLVLSGILFYMRGVRQERYFLLAGACAFLACLTKYHLALMLPLIGSFYCLRKRRSLSRNRYFILSLFGIPLAFLFIIAAFISEKSLGIFLFSYGYELSGRSPLSFNTLPSILINLMQFLLLSIPWIGFSLIGISRLNWKDPACQTIVLWAFLLFPALASKDPLFWYTMPVIPAFAILAAKSLGGMRDTLFTVVLIPLILTSFALVLLFGVGVTDQKEAGLQLAGKGNTLILTPKIIFPSWPDYYELYPNSSVSLVISAPQLVFYKLHYSPPGTRVSAGYFPLGQSDVGQIVSQSIQNSNADSVAITSRYRCRNFVGEQGIFCEYNFTVPTGFKEKKTSNGEYTILERIPG